ncbi:universal stress protein [Bradyrhizobium sp. LMTR 3]|uniref:universal stress protein n=1 Tax=Bradyrhizobium sp. LMTR 3 TaxID=189873 RepID=UPI00081050BB|nr:universal stress protein [Bradyrhizobium sp. LMTR 3]OCK54150.1 hypothetical protein LMTR3_23590 [Bradyrhizobium sp. LMTR 3]
MSYREILVYTGTGELAPRMCDYAANLASSLKARLVGLVVEADVIDFTEFDNALLDAERKRAFELLTKKRGELHEATLRTGSIFQEAAERHGVPHDTLFKTGVHAEIPGTVTDLARLYDCSILPSVERFGGFQVPIVEEVLFGSGRPLIVLPLDRPLSKSPDIVFVAWDGSRPATRAVHDAIPILRQATIVEVVSVTEEKPLERLSSGHDLVRHLKAHDVRARYGEVRFDGTPIGEQIMKAALRLDADLLVMGGYGHSRVRQIVFGGATRSVLAAPILPVFLSH